jgi:hypothetical protein
VSGERLGSRGLAKLTAGLSERDRAIVADVSQLKLLSARQIEVLHFDAEQHASALTAARTCRRVLNRLIRDRLLVRLQRRTVGGINAGSASFIYALGPVGHRLDPDGGPRRRFREPTATFVAHTLAIADVVIGVRLAERAKLVDIIAIESEPACWRAIGSHSGQVLRPDLCVRIGVGEYEHHAFVEVDLGTEGLPRLIAKCRTYAAYFDTGSEQVTHGIFPRIIWLLDDPRRAERLRAAIEKQRLPTGLFTVADLDDALSGMTEREVSGAKYAS